MAQEKIPGVYFTEISAFPNFVVGVATAVPAFIGYTKAAANGPTPLWGVPTRIFSMAEFERYFGDTDGTAPRRSFKRAVDADTGAVTYTEVGQRLYLSAAMRLFFNNGGHACWIVSVGDYEQQRYAGSDFDDAWPALAKEPEPTIYLAPDAVGLDPAGYKKVSEAMMTECSRLESRVAILDIHDGANPDINAVINDARTGFRNTVALGDTPSYGMVYFPWLNTTIIEAADIDYTNLDDASRKTLQDEITAEQTNVAGKAGKDLPANIAALVTQLTEAPANVAAATQVHLSLTAISPTYGAAMTGLLAAMNILPPSAAMAGVITRTDSAHGAFRAPANTGLVSVASPTVAISNAEQEDLNAPLDGKAVNAIRTFPGRGVLVWGARTLDGNSQDYRYISARRTLIMLEQSMSNAMQAYAFAFNDAGTWQTVKTMLESFLDNQWRAGALAGTKPADAYDVSIGFGTTMTVDDILEGVMRVTARVAVVRPAEFIVIMIEQRMQTT